MAARRARDVQQEFAESFGAERIVWDLFTEDQQNEVEEKLKTTFPSPDTETGIREIQRLDIDREEKNKKILEFLKDAEQQEKRIKECRTALLKALWNQRKYNNKNLLMSTIFVIITDPDRPDDDILNATEFACYPVFRIRKCRVGEDTNNRCMLFVDDAARVYKNWNDYLEYNVLPEGKIVVPRNGIYSIDISGNVLLTVHETPALKDRHLKKIDSGAGYAGMGAAVVTVGGLLLPVAAPVVAVAAAPVVAAASVVGVASAGWSAVRSAFQLRNRGCHEQSNDILNREARGHWLGVAGGVVGLGAAGATFGMVRAVAAGGNVSTMTTVAVNGLNASALLTNGLSVGNGFMELYFKTEDNEPITALEIAQLGASLFLFTHSVSNFQTAANIVESTRNGKISQIRNELSNRQRKMFDKMAKETVRIRGNEQGKIDIIRGLKNIPDNKYFNDVYKVNKQLNRNNIRPAFAADGTVLLNNEVSVDAQALRNNLQHGVGESVISRAGVIPPTHADGQPRNLYGNINVTSANKILLTVLNGVNACRISNMTDVQNLILNILSKFNDEILEKLIDIANEFMQKFVQHIQERVQRYIDFEEVLSRTFAITLKLTGGNSRLMTLGYINVREQEILLKLRDFFLNSNPSSTEGEHRCEECNGYYYISM